MGIDINYLSLILAVVSNVVLGMLWYGPYMFGEQWMVLTGKSKEEIENAGNMSKTYGIMVINAFLLAIVLSYLVKQELQAHYFNFPTKPTDMYVLRNDFVITFWGYLYYGLKTGILTWVGLIATTSLTNALFSDKPLKLWAIDAGYWLVVILINCMIISLW